MQDILRPICKMSRCKLCVSAIYGNYKAASY